MAACTPDLWTLSGPEVEASNVTYVGCSRISVSMSRRASSRVTLSNRIRHSPVCRYQATLNSLGVIQSSRVKDASNSGWIASGRSER